VAGGTGSRMNSVVPKQFLLLAGKPVLMHSILAFQEYDRSIQIIVALPGELFTEWETICGQHSFRVPHKLAKGGTTRFDSVKNALSFITADGIVAVHDGVRPLIGRSLISRAFDHAATYGNAVPVTPVTDSVRKADGSSSDPVDRNNLRLIQTPQTFNASIILKAYRQSFSESFTDDACVLESAGETINLIQGDPYNLKITYPEDMLLAEALMKYRQTD